MGQLLNRISRLIKSETNSSINVNNINLADDSDDLRRIIDELKNDKKEKRNNESNDKNSSDNSTANEIITLENAYKILNLKHNAPIDEIKSAYKKKMMEYHPDRVANLGEDIKKLAEKKTKEINKAYEVLMNYREF